MIDTRCIEAAATLWQFMSTQDEVGKPSVIFVFGSTDLIIAAFAASAYFQSNPKAIICSGGVAHQNDLLRTRWSSTEAQAFADVLYGFGVPRHLVHTECEALNTGDNFVLSRALAEANGVNLDDVLVIHKPYMTLRSRLTGLIRWPDILFRVASPRFDLAQYSKLFVPLDDLINILVGDFQRIVEYPRRGFSAPCSIPEAVQEAFAMLVDSGYTKHLLSK